jgi:hypothetical protein
LLVLIAIAVLVGAAIIFFRLSNGKSFDKSFFPEAKSRPLPFSAAKMFACPGCGQQLACGTGKCPLCGWSQFSPGVQLPEMAGEDAVLNEGLAAPPTSGRTREALPNATTLSSPREQNAAGKEFFEGHWLGLEVIALIPELAKLYQVQDGESGVLVDEITLEAAESGLLAGDVVQSIDECPTPDLKAFFLATQHVEEQKEARAAVSRRGAKMTFLIRARNTRSLGFAQMEAAQPIKPGAISPHKQRERACTECHIIMLTGGQLPTDAGDLVSTPPPITRGATRPHGNRGRCNVCHEIRY